MRKENQSCPNKVNTRGMKERLPTTLEDINLFVVSQTRQSSNLNLADQLMLSVHVSYSDTLS